MRAGAIALALSLLALVLNPYTAYFVLSIQFELTHSVGASMEPTFHDGSLNTTNRLAYVLREPARGDVIAFQREGDRVRFAKRIVGMPGEAVTVDTGTVLIDGERLDEPYLANASTRSAETVVVPAGEYYVMGDNRAVSLDSRVRDFGMVPRDDIIGRVESGTRSFWIAFGVLAAVVGVLLLPLNLVLALQRHRAVSWALLGFVALGAAPLVIYLAGESWRSDRRYPQY